MSKIGDWSVIIAAIITAAASIILFILQNRKRQYDSGKAEEHGKQARWFTEIPNGMTTIDSFYGDSSPIQNIIKYIKPDHKQLVSIIGLPGIGKRLSCKILANYLQNEFDNVGYIECKNDCSLMAQVLYGVINVRVNLRNKHYQLIIKEYLNGLSESVYNLFNNNATKARTVI